MDVSDCWVPNLSNTFLVLLATHSAVTRELLTLLFLILDDSFLEKCQSIDSISQMFYCFFHSSELRIIIPTDSSFIIPTDSSFFLSLYIYFFSFEGCRMDFSSLESKWVAYAVGALSLAPNCWTKKKERSNCALFPHPMHYIGKEPTKVL